MLDPFGGTELPIEVPQDGKDAVGDPLLTQLLSFWSTIANHYCSDAWRAVGADRVGPIASTFAYDPRDAEFNERDLPALFAWRESVEKRTWIAEDFFVEYGTITALWIPQPAVQAKLVRRQPFANGLFKALSIATSIGYDPCWRDGELLYGSTRFRQLSPLHSKMTQVTIDLDHSESRRYPAWELGVHYEEQWNRSEVELLQPLEINFS